MHKPCISVGDYGCESGAALMNLLVDKRVDLVLSGHEHTYQRTHQLTSGLHGDDPGVFTASCVADTDSSMVKGAGTVFATAGTGGAAPRNVNLADSEAPYMAATAGLNANGTYSSLDLTATAFTARRVDFRREVNGTSSADSDVTPSPSPSPSPTVATDDYQRTVVTGWGTATSGGSELMRNNSSGSTEVILQSSVALAGLTYAPGDRILVKVEAGGVRFNAYLSSSADNGRFSSRWTSLTRTRPDRSCRGAVSARTHDSIRGA